MSVNISPQEAEPKLVRTRPTVTVVIPTLGRPTLRDAVLSVVRQTVLPIEIVIVVVNNGEIDPQIERSVHGASFRVIQTNKPTGAARARMIGTEVATGDFVAFLDDDDTWLPTKLEKQLDAIREAARHGKTFHVVTCRANLVSIDGEHLGQEPKETFPIDDPDLRSFMFTRRHLNSSGFVFGSSTLMCTRRLLDVEPWRFDLRLHEDWEWLIRVSDRNDVACLMAPEGLVNYRSNEVGTSAATPPGGWRDSIRFAIQSGLSGVALGDFVLNIAAANALAHEGRWVAVRVAVIGISLGGRPSWRGKVVFFGQLILPQGALSRIRRAHTKLKTKNS